MGTGTTPTCSNGKTPPAATCSKIGEGIVTKPSIKDKNTHIPITNPLPNLPEREKCNIHFKCRHPGTYSLLFTISDDCSRAEEETTVSCQCATTPTVRATRTLYTSLYECSKDNRRFAPVEVTVAVDEVDGYILPRCTVPQLTVPAPTVAAQCPSLC